MATVRMKKNGLFADVFDSPETIKNAQMEGWAIVKDEKPLDQKVEEAIEKSLEPQVNDILEKTAEESKPRTRGRKPTNK